MSRVTDSSELRIKSLEQQLRDAEDRNYRYREMLLRVDRDEGSDYVKKPLSRHAQAAGRLRLSLPCRLDGVSRQESTSACATIHPLFSDPL